MQHSETTGSYVFLWFFNFCTIFSCDETCGDLCAEKGGFFDRIPRGKHQIFVRLTRTFFTFVVAILTRKYRKKQIFYAI